MYSYVVTAGEFGVVYRGHLVDWKGTKPTELVAVKTLKEGKCYMQCSTIVFIDCSTYDAHLT